MLQSLWPGVSSTVQAMSSTAITSPSRTTRSTARQFSACGGNGGWSVITSSLISRGGQGGIHLAEEGDGLLRAKRCRRRRRCRHGHAGKHLAQLRYRHDVVRMGVGNDDLPHEIRADAQVGELPAEQGSQGTHAALDDRPFVPASNEKHRVGGRSQHPKTIADFDGRILHQHRVGPFSAASRANKAAPKAPVNCGSGGTHTAAPNDSSISRTSAGL